MRRPFQASLLSAALSAAVGPWAAGQPDQQPQPPIVLDADVSAVTLYRDRAIVLRSSTLHLEAGTFDLRFDALPQSVLPETLQARVSGPAQVLGATYENATLAFGAPPPEKAAEAARARGRLAEIEDRLRILGAQQRFLDALIERGLLGETEAALDPEAVRRQIDFITTEQTRLVNEGRSLANERALLQEQLDAAAPPDLSAGPRMARRATVTVAVAQPGDLTIDLSYTVLAASWEPTYSIRARSGTTTVEIEYDALIRQTTGEDWNGVTLTLSTARPAIAAHPPELTPWFVERLSASGAGAEETGPAREGVPPELMAPGPTWPGEIPSGSEEPSFSYRLPRSASVSTDPQKQQRLRLASFEASAAYSHVAVPQLTNLVFVRADIVNGSDLLLLPGRAALSSAGQYMGQSELPAIAPRSRFSLFFGVDESVKATRTLLETREDTTGLFAGGLRTSYRFLIEVANDSGKPLNLELWDRRPASRDDQIRIELFDVNLPLVEETAYLEEDEPRGMLKWRITVPATARSDNPLIVTYGLRINRPKDIDLTELPD